MPRLKSVQFFQALSHSTAKSSMRRHIAVLDIPKQEIYAQATGGVIGQVCGERPHVWDFISTGLEIRASSWGAMRARSPQLHTSCRAFRIQSIYGYLNLPFERDFETPHLRRCMCIELAHSAIVQ